MKFGVKIFMKESDIRDQKRLKKFFSLMKDDSLSLIEDSSNFVDAQYESWGCGNIEYVFTNGIMIITDVVILLTYLDPRPSLNHLEEFYTNPKSQKYCREFFLHIWNKE